MFPNQSASCQNAINHADIPLAAYCLSPLDFLPPTFHLETREESRPTEGTNKYSRLLICRSV